MDVQVPLQMLGGLSPKRFMRQYWQKKPLLVRQAFAGFRPLLDPRALFALAARDEVQSRLVVQTPGKGSGWELRHGPFQRRALPALQRPGWTLLVQGVDLHVDSVHALMNQFRFVPEARLDDLMISYASDGGGVGPHYDSYDVFLLQAQGRRRWRIGKQPDRRLQADVPLKILTHFAPEEDLLLEPGDMLYLPLLHAHDGIAVGPCMTYSIGFRSPARSELAREMLVRVADEALENLGPAVYRDRAQTAVPDPGQIPAALQAFAQQSVHAALADPGVLARALGEYLTEPKAEVWFAGHADTQPKTLSTGIRLDRRSRMMFDAQHLYINGESFIASGRDAHLMRQLANDRRLDAAAVRRTSPSARTLLQTWLQAGWLHAE